MSTGFPVSTNVEERHHAPCVDLTTAFAQGDEMTTVEELGHIERSRLQLFKRRFMAKCLKSTVIDHLTYREAVVTNASRR